MSFLSRRYRRLRRRLRAAYLSGTLWKPLAIGEATLILCALGFGAGLALRTELRGLTSAVNRIAPLAETGAGRSAKAATPSATPAQASAPASAHPSASPSPQLSAVVQLAAAEASKRTGIAYVDGGCGSGQSCLSGARETDGQDAAYVEFSARGYGGASVCYVYLGSTASGWNVGDVACGGSAGFAPVQDATLTVHAAGTCGRLRRTPSTDGAVIRCLANGSTVTVTAPPIYGDGVIWWPVNATGANGVLAEALLIDPASLVPAR
jgi:hypothetical protein